MRRQELLQGRPNEDLRQSLGIHIWWGEEIQRKGANADKTPLHGARACVFVRAGVGIL